MDGAVSIRRLAVAMCTLTACLLLVGCGAAESSRSRPEQGTTDSVRKPVPDAGALVAQYNKRLEHLSRIKARAVVRLRYRDEDNELRNEQVEGLLQVIRPDRLALSLGKAGKTGAWFGCDASRYWWFDLEKTPSAIVGERTPDGEQARRVLGLSIAPWHLIELLGITPLNAADVRSIAWSSDGQSLVVTLRFPGTVAAAGESAAAKDQDPPDHLLKRLTVDPRNAFPARIEIVEPGTVAPDSSRSDSGAETVLAASELAGDERVELKDSPAGERPRMPATVFVTAPGQEAEIRLSLSGVTDARIADASFDFDKLLAHFDVAPERVRKAAEVLRERSAPRPAPASAGSTPGEPLGDSDDRTDAHSSR